MMMSMEMMDLEDEDGDEDGYDDHANQQVLSKDTHFVATLIVGPGYLLISSWLNVTNTPSQAVAIHTIHTIITIITIIFISMFGPHSSSSSHQPHRGAGYPDLGVKSECIHVYIECIDRNRIIATLLILKGV